MKNFGQKVVCMSLNDVNEFCEWISDSSELWKKKRLRCWLFLIVHTLSQLSSNSIVTTPTILCIPSYIGVGQKKVCCTEAMYSNCFRAGGQPKKNLPTKNAQIEFQGGGEDKH
jgi:hypothetical protein